MSVSKRGCKKRTHLNDLFFLPTRQPQAAWAILPSRALGQHRQTCLCLPVCASNHHLTTPLTMRSSFHSSLQHHRTSFLDPICLQPLPGSTACCSFSVRLYCHQGWSYRGMCLGLDGGEGIGRGLESSTWKRSYYWKETRA